MLKKCLLIIYQKGIQPFLFLLIPEVTGGKIHITLLLKSVHLYQCILYFPESNPCQTLVGQLATSFCILPRSHLPILETSSSSSVASTGKCKISYSLVELCFRRFKLSFLSRATVDFLLFARHLLI